MAQKKSSSAAKARTRGKAAKAKAARAKGGNSTDRMKARVKKSPTKAATGAYTRGKAGLSGPAGGVRPYSKMKKPT